MEKKPNKAPEPTTFAVTSRALDSFAEVKTPTVRAIVARAAPAKVVAHLYDNIGGFRVPLGWNCNRFRLLSEVQAENSCRESILRERALGFTGTTALVKRRHETIPLHEWVFQAR
jgi:hypothetical protein